MKKLLLFTLLVVSCQVKAQSTYKAVKMLEECQKINSSMRLGGITRVKLPLQVPTNTAAIYYTIQTSKQRNPSFVQLTLQLAKALHPAVNAAISLLSLQGEVTGTTGEAPVDVVLLEGDGNANAWVNKQTASVVDRFSRSNFTSGTVAIPMDGNHSQLWIGIRNPSATTAVFVSVEVTAIVEE